MLARGEPAIDVVEHVVALLEDDPLFNAGRGAVFTAEGRNELDASIMEGSGLRCGGVAGLTTVRNPIRLARKVMMDTPHVRSFMSDRPAEEVERVMRKRDAVCPMGHMGSPWDAAHAALFLASDEARYITGAELVVDGGLTL